jgi:hypothetical protein
VSEKLASFEPRVIKFRLRDTRRFVESRLKNLQSMFSGEPRLARAAIAQHVQKITLKPEGRSYIGRVFGIGSAAWRLQWCRRRGLHHACHRV